MKDTHFRFMLFLLASTISLSCSAQTKTILNSNFQEGIAPIWHQQKAASDRIQLVYDKDLNKKVLKFTVKPGDIVVNHNRSELNLADDSIVGLGDRIYTWQFKIPTDSMEPFSIGKWRIIGQWHDKPDAGMSWDQYNSVMGGPHPPPIAVELFQKDQIWMVGIRYGLQYGKDSDKKSERRIIATGQIKPNEWNTIIVHIHWSKSDDGMIEAKLNNDIITPYNGKNYLVKGRNMFNNVPCAFKIGIYRASVFTTPDIVYYSDVKIEVTNKESIF